MDSQYESEGTGGRPGVTAGDLISHYRIERRLGEGGMGEVFLAQDTSLSRKVAIKFLAADAGSFAENRTRILSEARAIAQLDHPNIVTVYEVSEHEGHPFLVLQYIEGPTLGAYAAGESLGIPQILDIVVQVCDGLQAVHALGITHGDVKPLNILMDSTGRARVVDFGLATIRREAIDYEVGFVTGTLAYLSPEQSRGERPEAESDVWAVGVLLYELLTGRNPFSGEYEQQVLYALANEPAPPMAKFRADLPAGVEEIVSVCLSKRAANRYHNAGELGDALRRVSESFKYAGRAKAKSRAMDKPSVAVLPFRDMSSQADQEYFCEGIAEELINMLARVDGLFVSARTSAFQFKGQDIDIRKIGEQLGVRTVLEGSVRTSGNRIRVTTQLVNVADGYQLWSEKFDRDFDDIFAIQDEISLAVVTKLKDTLLDEDRKRIAGHKMPNKDAYQLYLKGRYFWSRRYEGELQRALQFFKQTIDLDPEYAPAYTGIADCYSILAQYGWMRPMDAFPKAKVAVERALQLDPDLSEAHTSLGWIRNFHDWDFKGARAAFERAIALNQNNVTAYQWYAVHLGPMNRFPEGWKLLDRAMELDPLSITVHAIAGLGFYNERRFDEAVNQLQKTLEMDGGFFMTLLFLGWAYTAQARWPEAATTLQKLTALPVTSPIALASLGMVHGLSGSRDLALAAIDKLEEMAARVYVSPFYFAMIWSGLSERDKAFAYLDRAVVEREPFMVTLSTFPLLDILRTDARYDGLLKRVGHG